jgi:TPP-dependent pyruvate/acetoin dehydrogenase alpha subunit
MVNAIGMKTYAGNGYDAIETHEILSCATKYVKSGFGPAFVELSTYRWREHCGPHYDNHIGYRAEQEFLEWKERDPLKNLLKYLISGGYLLEDEFTQTQQEISLEIDNAFRFAKESEFASYKDCSNLVFK